MVRIGLLPVDERLRLAYGGLAGRGFPLGQVYLHVLEFPKLLANACEALLFVEVLQKGGKPAKLAVLFAALEGVDLIEAFGLQQSRDVIVIDDDDVLGASAERPDVFEEVGFVDGSAVFAVEAVRHSVFGVDQVDDPGGIQFLAGCEDDDFVEFGHFKEEGIEAEPFHRVNSGAFAVEDDLRGGRATSDSKSYLGGLVKVVWMRV